MPYLGDYLGHLLSEITIARMHADIEAVRVAELYADHPLLRHMPIPRFRMPEVELDVPIVVKEVEEKESIHTQPTIADMRKIFDKVTISVLAGERIKLDPADQRKLKTALDKKATGLSRPAEIAFDMNRVANEFSKTTVTLVAGIVESEKKIAFEARIKDAMRVEMVKLRKPQPRLFALVTTSEVKEAGPNEVITRLRLKVLEEGFEWTTIESGDDKVDRLIIE